MKSLGDYRAFLGNEGCFTVFSYGPHVVRFRTPRNLKRYLRVKEWDGGYLVVDADYEGLPSSVEEYIDLVPILRNLYLDPEAFLSPHQGGLCPMSEDQIRFVADNADMVINGYAFTACEDGLVKVLSLHEPFHASLLADDGSVIETNMDDIEVGIAQEYLERNREFLVV